MDNKINPFALIAVVLFWILLEFFHKLTMVPELIGKVVVGTVDHGNRFYLAKVHPILFSVLLLITR